MIHGRRAFDTGGNNGDICSYSIGHRYPHEHAQPAKDAQEKLEQKACLLHREWGWTALKTVE